MASRRLTLFLAALVIVTPIAGLIVLPRITALPEFELHDGGYRFEPAAVPMRFENIGPTFQHTPLICNVQVLDFDGDGKNDVLVCDARTNQVICYRQIDGGWDEQILGEDLLRPAHATVVDIDKDGDNDVLVSILGALSADNAILGKVILLEQAEPGSFEQHVILDDVRRVADVQPGDFDSDGDIDLAVAVFGYDMGSILWLENRGEGRWFDHELHWAPGTVHVPVADYDGDGDLDIAAVVSQDEEEIWVFENDGKGSFTSHRVHFSWNFDLGSGGLVADDLDQDGDVDLLWPVGDNFEDKYAYPQPYHGCFWLENKGGLNFEARRIGTYGGTYACAAGDVDGDGDRDVVLVSMTNDWGDERNASVVLLENDGSQQFTEKQIASDPIQMATVACGDLNGDGRDDIVGGGLHGYPPFIRFGRINAWISTEGSP